MRIARVAGGAGRRVMAALLAAALVAAACTESSSDAEKADREKGAGAAAQEHLAGVVPLRYVYDEVGRLAAVSDPESDTAIYSYDPGGNLLSIERRASAELSVIAVEPASAAVGETVTIHGTGFDDDPDANVVRFGQVRTTAIQADSGALSVEVPEGARTGQMVVMVGGAETVSPRPFNPCSTPSHSFGRSDDRRTGRRDSRHRGKLHR